MDELQVEKLELKFRNRFIIHTLILSCSLGLVFKSLQLIVNQIVPEMISTVMMLVILGLMLFCRYWNERNRWLDILPHICITSAIVLAMTLFYFGKREAILLTAYLLILLFSIYKRRKYTIVVFGFGLLAHVYYLPKIDLDFSKDPLSIVMYIIFYVLYVIMTILAYEFNMHLFKKVRYAHAKTNEKLMELEQERVGFVGIGDQFRLQMTNVSQQLKEPIESIIHTAKELEANESTHAILEEAYRLKDVLNEIDHLQLSKGQDEGEADQVDRFLWRDFQVEEVVQHQIDLLYPIIGGKPIKVVNQLVGNGPNKGQWPKVRADYYCVNQVINHLISDAVGKTAKGTIKIAASIGSTMLELTIQRPNEIVATDPFLDEMEYQVIREMCEFFGGQMEYPIDSDKSTQLRISIPLADGGELN